MKNTKFSSADEIHLFCELVTKEPGYESIDRLLSKMPSMDATLLRYCLNTGKRLRAEAKTRTEQDKATKLIMQAEAYLREL